MIIHLSLTGHCPESKARDALRHYLQSSRFKVGRFLSLVLLEAVGGKEHERMEKDLDVEW